jgi:hypothetical protein
LIGHQQIDVSWFPQGGRCVFSNKNRFRFPASSVSHG